KGNILTGAATVSAADDLETGNLRWVYSGHAYDGFLESNRQRNVCLVWNIERKTLVPQDLGVPSPFICQREFIAYTHTYVVSIPRACAEGRRNFYSRSTCQSSSSFKTTSWVALSAAYPADGVGSSPVHIRLSVPPDFSQTSYFTGQEAEMPGRSGTLEETRIQPKGGFYRSFNLTHLSPNRSGPQDPYLLVQSTSYISLVLVVWRERDGDVTSVCSSLVNPVGWGNATHASFFSPTASAEATVGKLNFRI
ncbi:hypothetical protein ElyMa_000121700, partial [Elysia marginata]